VLLSLSNSDPTVMVTGDDTHPEGGVGAGVEVGVGVLVGVIISSMFTISTIVCPSSSSIFIN